MLPRLLFLVLLFIPSLTWADFTGEVVRVMDGDTIAVMHNGQAVLYTVPPNVAHVEEYRKAQAERGKPDVECGTRLSRSMSRRTATGS